MYLGCLLQDIYLNSIYKMVIISMIKMHSFYQINKVIIILGD